MIKISSLNGVIRKPCTLVVMGDVDRKLFCGYLDDFLEELNGEDFFGTEGQLDPRGDRRNK